MSEAEDTTTLAEDLGEAFDALEEEETTDEGEEETGGSAEDTTESVGDAETQETDDGGDEGSEDDDAGDKTEVDDTSADAKTVSDTPAPASWSPENREHWGELPAEVRQQVEKREREIDTGLREASDAKRFQEHFDNTVNPYRDTIAIEAGGDAMLATRNLMNIATGLRVGAQPQKAQLIAQIIQQYGVDIATLDTVLSGQIGPQAGPAAPVGGGQPSPAQAFRDPRVDQMLARQQQDLQESTQQVEADTAAFMQDPDNEFAMDLRNDMADLMEMAARRNETLDFKGAYEKATKMSPAIQQILTARADALKGKSGDSLKRKKRASKTISGTPSGDGTNIDNSKSTVADDVSAAWDSVVGGDG